MVIFITLLLIKINKQSIKQLIAKYPYIKLELALVLPLMFSTFMWVHLATRTAYDSRPKQNVTPPELVVISEQSNIYPKMKVTPQKLIITPVDNANIEGYLFPNIKAIEYKNLKVVSRNGILFDSQNRLMVKPLDDQPITIEFQTDKINRALLITLLSWAGVVIFFITISFQTKKVRDD
ncbi:MAG: hypothetical protein GWP19_11300 [Planctomycetia bacterium]|nr:hypothetical protein [Planctomycetia bacterium]